MDILPLKTRRLHAVQNSISFLIFGFLASAQASAMLLHSGVRYEWSWVLSIELNRIAAPALDPYLAFLSGHPLIAFGLLLACCAAPLLALWRSNWLATATAGHVALGISILLMLAALQKAAPDVRSASLLDVPIKTAAWTNATTLLAITAVMGFLCVMNHIAFFARPSGRPSAS